jgi:hypothetical protein
MTEVKIYDPYEIDNDEWHDLQQLARTAFTADLSDSRSQAEINELVGWSEPDRYISSHLDPNTERGRRYNDAQDFRDPRVAVAKLGSELVGFGYIASNVSGETEEARDHKYRTIVKRYAWIREVVVAPDHRQKQIATRLGAALLSDKTINALQPVSTYVWPDEMPWVKQTLSHLGFEATGTVEDHPFGETAAPTQLTRMQARTAFGVARRLKRSLHHE